MNKKSVLLFVFFSCFSFAFLQAQNPACDGNRYKNYAFQDCDSTLAVQFGQNYTMNNVLKDLKMDIYQPKGDLASKRPLIIFLHGGSFYSGSRKDLRLLCIPFAMRGFVTATIDYRLIDVAMTDSFIVAEGMVKAMSDAKAAIRFFVEDAATTNNYKIDVDNIFIGGVSAGAIISNQVAYLNSTDVIPAYFSNLLTANGGFIGNSSGNTSYSMPIKGVLNYSGALWRKSWLNAGEPALFSAHDNLDPVVPCGHALSSTSAFPIYFNGSCVMQQQAISTAVPTDAYYVNAVGHVSYFLDLNLGLDVIQKTADFITPLICNGLGTSNQSEFANEKFQIFPNPTRNHFRVSLLGEKVAVENLEIFNSAGALVREIEFSQAAEIDIVDLPNGLYYVRLKTDPTQSLKLLKQ